MRYYILRFEDLLIVTNHKPLIKILDDHPLANITNRRLLNVKEKTLPYRFTMIHVSGLRNIGPDTASRYPTQAGEDLQLPSEPLITPVSCEDLAHDAGMFYAACTNLSPVWKVVMWAMVREATTSDASMQQLVAAIQEGFPHNLWDTPAELQPYHRYSERKEQFNWCSGAVCYTRSAKCYTRLNIHSSFYY